MDSNKDDARVLDDKDGYIMLISFGRQGMAGKLA